MPADRELAVTCGGCARATSRIASASRALLALVDWRMLAPLVPAAPRAALERRRMRPVIAFDGDHAVIWQAAAARTARIELVELARIPLAGDAAAVGGRARGASLAQLPPRAAPHKVVVALPPRAILRKTLMLPAAIEHDLRQALAYDLDRHTPFKPDELYFDAQVVDRDPARGQITVDLRPRAAPQVDAAVAHAEGWGAKVVAVTPARTARARDVRAQPAAAGIAQRRAVRAALAVLGCRSRSSLSSRSPRWCSRCGRSASTRSR